MSTCLTKLSTIFAAKMVYSMPSKQRVELLLQLCLGQFAVVLVANNMIAVQQGGIWQAATGIVESSVIHGAAITAEEQRIVDSILVGKPAHLRLAIESDAENAHAAISISLLNLDQRRNFAATGCAPRRPEIDYQYLGLPVFEYGLAAIESGQRYCV